LNKIKHAHTQTAALLSSETSDFISPQYWPPNSPDFDLVDYAVLGIFQQQVYHCRIRDVSHL